MMARSTTLQSEAGYIDARPFTTSSTNPLATHGRTIHPGHSRRGLAASKPGYVRYARIATKFRIAAK